NKLLTEKQHLERSLQAGDYAPDKQAELRQLDQYLQQANYNEQDHALARSEVERWRSIATWSARLVSSAQLLRLRFRLPAAVFL
ncbi:hypothetical protein FM036_41020, partial [Nostoc sp. HG1]|nr:hypothetical protein [Nostoc sp. HG1]